jgi:hypothetical protein
MKKRRRFAGQGAKLQKGEALEAASDIARRFEVPPGLNPEPLRLIPEPTIGRGKAPQADSSRVEARLTYGRWLSLARFFALCGGAATARTIAPQFGYFALTVAALCLTDRRRRRGAVNMVDGNA